MSLSVTNTAIITLMYVASVKNITTGQESARRVKILLDAEPAPAGIMPVVLSAEAGGTMIHEAVGHGLEADLACNGLSVYQGKIGEQVASPLITVIDDGTMPARRGSKRAVIGVDRLERAAAQEAVSKCEAREKFLSAVAAAEKMLSEEQESDKPELP